MSESLANQVEINTNTIIVPVNRIMGVGTESFKWIKKEE